MFYSSALARVECVCGSKAMSSLTSPTSHTNSVKINSKQNLVCLTKKSFFDPSLTAPTLGARSFMGVQKLFSAYRGTYSRRGRRISLPELIIAPLTCENS